MPGEKIGPSTLHHHLINNLLEPKKYGIKNLATDADSSKDTNKILLKKAKFARKKLFFARQFYTL